MKLWGRSLAVGRTDKRHERHFLGPSPTPAALISDLSSYFSNMTFNVLQQTSSYGGNQIYKQVHNSRRIDGVCLFSAFGDHDPFHKQDTVPVNPSSPAPSYAVRSNPFPFSLSRAPCSLDQEDTSASARPWLSTPPFESPHLSCHPT